MQCHCELGSLEALHTSLAKGVNLDHTALALQPIYRIYNMTAKTMRLGGSSHLELSSFAPISSIIFNIAFLIIFPPQAHQINLFLVPPGCLSVSVAASVRPLEFPGAHAVFMAMKSLMSYLPWLCGAKQRLGRGLRDRCSLKPVFASTRVQWGKRSEGMRSLKWYDFSWILMPVEKCLVTSIGSKLHGTWLPYQATTSNGECLGVESEPKARLFLASSDD